MPEAAGCGGPGSVTENWDVPEWMQVGNKLPTALGAELCASVSPVAVPHLFALGVSRCWGRFGRISSPGSSLAGARSQPAAPMASHISVSFPACWSGTGGSGGVAGLESARSSFWAGWSLGVGDLNSPSMGWWWISTEERGFIPGVPGGSGMLSSLIPVASVAMAITCQNKGELELGTRSCFPIWCLAP